MIVIFLGGCAGRGGKQDCKISVRVALITVHTHVRAPPTTTTHASDTTFGLFVRSVRCRAMRPYQKKANARSRRGSLWKSVTSLCGRYAVQSRIIRQEPDRSPWYSASEGEKEVAVGPFSCIRTPREKSEGKEFTWVNLGLQIATGILPICPCSREGTQHVCS